MLIDIPIDIQNQELKKFQYPEEVNIRGYKPSVKGNDLQIKRVAEAISKAKQPLICAGGGVGLAHAQKELLELAERNQIPVVKTMMGLSLMATDHPLNMGMIGAHGNHCANKTLAKADLLIMVGTRAADRAVIDPAEIQRRMATIHIDVDPAEIGKNMQAAIPLVGNVKVILRQILDRDVAATDSAAWLEKLRDYRKAELNRVFPRRAGSVFPGTVLRRLGARLDDDAVICVDVGQNQIFACKYIPQKHGRLLTSGGLGTMGYGFPAAVGAQFAFPQKKVITVAGDASLQMNIQELATVVANKLPIKVIILNNRYLGMVRQWQDLFYNQNYSSTNMEAQPDFVKLAEAYGAEGYRITSAADLRPVLEKALGTPNPAFIDVVVEREENVYPIVPAGAALDEMLLV